MQTRNQTLQLTCVVSLFLLLILPLTASSDESTTPETPDYLTKKIKKIDGPKRVVAVGDFTATGSYAGEYGSWDIGSGLSAMLTSALVESGQFVVVDRSKINDVLTEQKLAVKNLTTETTGAQVGKLTGAQFYVYGVVTQFDTNAKSSGFGGAVSKVPGLSSFATKKTEGTIAIDLSLVDTTSGEIADSFSVEKTVKGTGFDISVGYEGIALGGDQFVKTPLGEATREAITEAVAHIAEKAADSDWMGKVVMYEAGMLYINAGSNSGIETGDKFLVRKIDRVITDPDTEKILMVRWIDLGEVLIDQAEPDIAFGEYFPLGSLGPERGDFVVLVN